MKQRFYSNGKLLITGEYLVLDGAKALALPTIYGQDLCISKNDIPGIQWRSFDHHNILWFETQISYNEIVLGADPENREVRNMLINILHGAYLQNPKYLQAEHNLLIETHLDFDRSWGLGTSSTLINNIAEWTKTDAFTLLKTTFGGSGYDIAVAKAKSAIIYKIEKGQSTFESINFSPKFRDLIYFVHLNKKQDSNAVIKNYKRKGIVSEKDISKINQLTEQIKSAESFDQFCLDLENHEQIISKIIQVPTIKEELFQDFHGTIKSLGGWGGDFILAATKENPTTYFQAKGYETVIPYSKMILE